MNLGDIVRLKYKGFTHYPEYIKVRIVRVDRIKSYSQILLGTPELIDYSVETLEPSIWIKNSDPNWTKTMKVKSLFNVSSHELYYRIKLK